MSTRKRIAVLTGAGISVDSGFETFRGNGGLWDKYPVEEVASHAGWYRNRKLVLDFYNNLRLRLRDAEPNEGHRLVAALERNYDVTVITQNVDNLHERAGSTDVLHLHGELTKVRPEDGIYERTGDEREVIDIGYAPVRLGDCAPSGIQLRPHIVFFGEAVPNIEKAARIVSEADLMLIVGTSLQVYPAAGLSAYVRRGAPVYVIDPADIPLPAGAFIHIRKGASEGMRDFIAALGDRGF